MAVSTQSIIDAARTTADIKLSRHLLDSPDLIGFLNTLVSELYDRFVAEKEGYFKATCQLTQTPNASFVSFVQSVPGVTVVNTGNTIALATPNVGLATKYRISNLSITPTLANLGRECSFVIAVNGVNSSVGVIVKEGYTPPPAVTDTHSVNVALGDILTLVIAPTNPALSPGSNWNFNLAFNVDPVTDVNIFDLPSDFFKELEVWGGTIPGQNRIYPLDSYHDRGTQIGYWLSGRKIEFYPANIAPSPAPVNLDYVPDCPVLTLTQNLPYELERFREWLETGLTIKIFTVRQKPVPQSLDMTFKRLDERVNTMVTARKSSPRVPAIPDKDKARFVNDWRRRYPYPQG